MRVDKEKNTAKVLSEVIRDPFQTQREIAANTGLGLGTVNRLLDNVEQIGTKDERLVKLVTGDISLQEMIQQEKMKRMTVPEAIRNNELDQWEQTALKRSQLLGGGATDNSVITIKFAE